MNRSSRFPLAPAKGDDDDLAGQTVRYELDERRHGLTLSAASGRDGGIAQIYARVGSATDAWAAVADRAEGSAPTRPGDPARPTGSRGELASADDANDAPGASVSGVAGIAWIHLDKNHPGRVTRDHRSVLGDLARHGDRHRAADAHRRVRAVAGVRRPRLPARRCRPGGEPLSPAARVLCSAGSLSTTAHGAQSLPSTWIENDLRGREIGWVRRPLERARV